MRKKSISAISIAVVIGALALAPTALGGSGQACPQASSSGCERIGARPGEPPRSNQQRVRPLPRFAFNSNGQQVWRAGNHLMQ
jgi:hypothetical protein